jgi:hypothetical protein
VTESNEGVLAADGLIQTNRKKNAVQVLIGGAACKNLGGSDGRRPKSTFTECPCVHEFSTPSDEIEPALSLRTMVSRSSFEMAPARTLQRTQKLVNHDPTGGLDVNFIRLMPSIPTIEIWFFFFPATFLLT